MREIGGYVFAFGLLAVGLYACLEYILAFILWWVV